jgi:hypothetical protein
MTSSPFRNHNNLTSILIDSGILFTDTMGAWRGGGEELKKMKYTYKNTIKFNFYSVP